MGAIVSNFPQLPADADPNRVAVYAAVYSDLTRLGLALPATPANAITRADLLAHLQGLVGQIIKDELTNNPEVLDYAGTDANTANEINRPYQPPSGRRWPGSNQTGYRTIVGSTLLGLSAELNPGGGDPGFLGPVFSDVVPSQGVIRFRLATTTVALRGQARIITLVPASNQLALSNPLPVIPPAGEIFDIGQVHPTIVLPPRFGQISRVPFCPNALTAADIAAAKL